jgi:uncharacterized membrane protein
VATLSPSQRDWLRRIYYGEIAAPGKLISQKTLDAQDTVEYRTHVIKDLYLFNLLPVLEWLSRPDAADYTLRLEIIYWVSTAKRLASSHDFQTAVIFLARKNSALRTLTSQEFGSDSHFLTANMSLRSQQILESILEPYVQGALVE